MKKTCIDCGKEKERYFRLWCPCCEKPEFKSVIEELKLLNKYFDIDEDDLLFVSW